MRIAIDCRTALSPKTGDRTYTLNLLRGLAKVADEEFPSALANCTFSLLLDKPAPQGLFPESDRFEQVVIQAANSRVWTALALPAWAWKNRPDLVHVQYLGPPGLPCPFVTTIHDVVWRAMPGTFPPKDRQVMKLFMPITVRLARKIITESQASRSEISRFFRGSAPKIEMSTNAVDEKFFGRVHNTKILALRARYHLGEAPYVLSVGVLQPRKNVPRLIEAFRQLKIARPDLPHQLVITGKPGWGADADLAKRHPGVRFTGYVDDAELPTLYAGATAFAYPSLYEGFGIPVIEAQAAGTPVLTSNRSCLPEVAGGAALLVNPRSVAAIGAGLEQILTDVALRRRLIKKGRVNAATYTVERQALTTLDVYAKALKQLV